MSRVCGVLFLMAGSFGFLPPASACHAFAAELQYISRLPGEGSWTRLEFSSASEGCAFTRTAMWTTSDGGLNWSPVSLPESGGTLPMLIQSAQFLDSKVIIVANGHLFGSDDLGVNWDKIGSPIGGKRVGEIVGARFLPHSARGWAWGGVYAHLPAGEGAPNNALLKNEDGTTLVMEPAVFRTDDGGRHWTPTILRNRSRSIGYRVLEVSPPDHNTLLAVTEMCALRTMDAGEHWRAGLIRQPKGTNGLYVPDLADPIRDLYALNARLAWLADDDGSLYQTTDGGAHWTNILKRGSITASSGTTSHLISMLFISSQVGWSVEMSGSLLETADGGKSWARIGDKKTPYSEVLQIGASAYAVADDGLYRISKPGADCLSHETRRANEYDAVRLEAGCFSRIGQMPCRSLGVAADEADRAIGQ
jgi:photosystem II stability/assembly factor-like uncharacterized protein